MRASCEVVVILCFALSATICAAMRRACLSSTQLSTYYVGNMEVNDLRRNYKEKRGAQFDLKEFHDKLLSFGSIAPKYIKILLYI